jgi:hypothetical protein
MFGSAFRSLWSVATDTAKTAASAIATGAKVIGQAPVIAAGIESVLTKVDTFKRQTLQTVTLKAYDAAAVTVTEWKSWMNVKVAQTGAAVRVVGSGVVGGLHGASAQAAREAAKIEQARSRGQAAVARRQAAAKADEAVLRDTHTAEWTGLKAASQARMQAAKNLRSQIAAAGQSAGDRLVSEVERAGEKGQRVADNMDKKAAKLAHGLWHEIRQQYSRMVPHICIPCLKGDLALLASGNFSDLALSIGYHRIGAIAEGLSQHLATGGYRLLTFFKPDLNAPNDKNPQNRHDGDHIGGDCLGQKQDRATKTPGKVPYCCKNGARPKKKITFVNGIMTDVIRPADGVKPENGNICDAMQDIADTACAEVVGIYNATNGMLADLAECVENIQGSSVSPATMTLYADVMRKLVADDEPIDIYAHSQGGLITQEALTRVRDSLFVKYKGDTAAVDRAMSRIRVRSFGTAEKGWPAGPQYTHLRNTNDPVPHVIDGAQRDLIGPYDPPDYDQRKAQNFTAPAGGVFANHGMTETYMPKLRELRDKGDESTSDLWDGYDRQNKRCKCQ